MIKAAFTAAAIGLASAQQSKGTVQAVYDMLERVLPGSSAHFALSMVSSCPGITAGKPCFTLSDGAGGQLAIAGTSASELTAGVGHYFRDYCNITVGWPRGGGSNIFMPSSWPAIGANPVSRARIAPYSYIMNVCTHSYSLVWYDWPAWERFIDWMALSGINLALAMTGQEEVQYKVFEQYGLDDYTIRSWFNGPAFLTWSRGQNEYGNNIAGPLPRSWMQAQWALQQNILTRYRSLGIVSQLPGFQGNVPWALAGAQSDSNITQQGDTGWMYSTDPLFSKLADSWMQTLCADFGCSDHWYQLDGYFDGGTAPWRTQGVGAPGSPGAVHAAQAQGRSGVAGARRAGELPSPVGEHLPACTWSTLQAGTYLAGCDDTNCISYTTIATAQAACLADVQCGGITSQANGQGPWELRAGNQPLQSPSGEASYYITNNVACRPPPGPIVPNSAWMERGAAAYMGLNRTDPQAIWSFQGWAIVDWSTVEQGESFRGFVDAVPKGNFVVIDMSVDGSGEWQKWNNSYFFGAPFVWTTLHDFGGTNGMKGELARINLIPFEVLPNTTAAAAGAGSSTGRALRASSSGAAAAMVDGWTTGSGSAQVASGSAEVFNATVLGTGYTPEGIDQNPAYYEFMGKVNFHDAPVNDITGEIVIRSHRRYGLKTQVPAVTQAWSLLVNSTYAQDLSVQDSTGVPHFPGSSSQFNSDRYTPTPRLCLTYQAWGLMIQAADSVDTTLEPFRYDLVNLGRELLAQLSTPVSMNFSDALAATTLNGETVNTTGQLYIDLLSDIDTLVATDSAFLIGPWLALARSWGANSSDCADGTTPMDCPSFYEWNARSQLTTWNPVPQGATSIPGGPIDYASKHWSGLIGDYYAARAKGRLALAQAAVAAGRPYNKTADEAMWTNVAYAFQHGYPNTYPLQPVGDYIAVSKAMYAKWGKYYAAC